MSKKTWIALGVMSVLGAASPGLAQEDGTQEASDESYLQQLRAKADCEERRADAALERLERSEQERLALLEEIEEEQAQAQEEEVTSVPIAVRASLFFEAGEDELNEMARQQLQEIATTVADGPEEVQVIIQGNADANGSTELNESLAQDRAMAVRDFLVEQGVDESQVIAEGNGDQEPLGDNQTAEGRALNRRVDVNIQSDTATGGSGEEGE